MGSPIAIRTPIDGGGASACGPCMMSAPSVWTHRVANAWREMHNEDRIPPQLEIVDLAWTTRS